MAPTTAAIPVPNTTNAMLTTFASVCRGLVASGMAKIAPITVATTPTTSTWRHEANDAARNGAAASRPM